MEVVSRTLARSLWHFPLDETNPKGLEWAPVLAAIKSQYRFGELKSNQPPTPGPLYRFLNGVFPFRDGSRIEVPQLDFFPDGITADTKHSSAASDAFIEDLLEFLSQKHGLLYEPSMVTKKAYLSEMYLKSDFDVLRISPGLPDFCGRLTRSIGIPNQFAPAQITFAASDTQLSFTLSRRSGVPFERNRYHSSAPVDTQTHSELIEALIEALHPRQ